MKIIKYPHYGKLETILQRPAIDNSSLQEKVRAVMDEVKLNGDAAVKAIHAAI
jgi:histidinol dehydrogenase